MLDYPKDKFEILVAAGNSTDKTNSIVERFIDAQPDYRVRLYCSQEHKGKTNAQNEAQRTVKDEIFVLTDANTMVKRNAIRESVASYISRM